MYIQTHKEQATACYLRAKGLIGLSQPLLK